MALTTQVTNAVTRSRVRWVLGQVLVVALGIFVYFRIRGITDASVDVAHAHADDIVALERWLGIDVEGTVQAPVASSQTLAAAANWVYVWGHWPVIVAAMVWLVWRHRDAFRRLRDAMLVSGFLGMGVFVSYPVAPPRLFDLGLVDTVTESSEAYRYLQPPAFVNQYAAMPSLHAGWDLLVGTGDRRCRDHRRTCRSLGVRMPVLMMWAVVATANHYVLDVVAGVVLALIGHAVALHLERQRARNRARSVRDLG